MDFNKYYADQINGLSGFKGIRYQRGYGVGSMFRKFVKWIIPIIKNNAVPLINKSANIISDNLSQGLTNLYTDADDESKNIKESAQERLAETFGKIKNTFQKGSGTKKSKVKRLSKNLSKKKKFDSIFD